MAAQSKPIERICCVCRAKQPISGMVRVVKIKNADGGFSFAVDKDHKQSGRGCHICPKCIDTAIKKKALNRSFKCNVDESIYECLATWKL